MIKVALLGKLVLGLAEGRLELVRLELQPLEVVDRLGEDGTLGGFVDRVKGRDDIVQFRDALVHVVATFLL